MNGPGNFEKTCKINDTLLGKVWRLESLDPERLKEGTSYLREVVFDAIPLDTNKDSFKRKTGFDYPIGLISKDICEYDTFSSSAIAPAAPTSERTVPSFARARRVVWALCALEPPRPDVCGQGGRGAQGGRLTGARGAF